MPNQSPKWFPKRLEDDSFALVGKVPNISKLLNKEGETLAEAGGSAVAHNDLIGRDIAGCHPASAIAFDNTDTDLSATQVQTAIAELAEGHSPEFLFTDILYVDKDTIVATENQEGSLSKPYATIQQALTALGQPTSAADFQRNILIDIITSGTYTEDLTVPHRAITIRGRGITIDGNITRQISDQKEYSTSSSVWRGTLSLVGFEANARDNHQLNRQGIKVTGNYQCSVISGETGNTTHDTMFFHTRIDGQVILDSGIGTEVFYTYKSRFNGDIDGASLYWQRCNDCQISADNVLIGWLIQFDKVTFINGDIWSGYTDINLTVNNFDEEELNITNSNFKSVNLTVGTGKTIKIDAVTLSSWNDEVTYVTNTPTVSYLDKASGVGNDSTVKGNTVKNALENLEDAIQGDEESGSILNYASGIKAYSSTPSGTGTKPKDVFVAGRFAYQLQHATPGFLIIWDISDPYSPVKKGTLSIDNGPNSIEVKNDIAYIGCNTGRLYIVDVSDPDNPTTLSSNQFGGTSQKFDIAVHKTQDIVAMADAVGNGLYLVDVSDPTAPTQVFNQAFSSGGVDIEGDLCYITDYGLSAVRVYDISTPASATLEQTHSIGTMVVSISVKDKIVYVGEYSQPKMYVVDFTTLASPVDKATLNLSGNPTNEGSASVKKDNLLYIFTGNGNVEIYNVEDLDDIFKITSYSFGHTINGGSVSKAFNAIVVPDYGVNSLTLLGDIRSDVLASDIITRRARYFQASDMGTDEASFATKKYVDDNDASDKHYSQSFTDETSVSVNHNLGKFPSVTVLDSSGYEVICGVQHIDNNNLTLTFSESKTGNVYCN